jgi:hypothetical protein
MTRAWKVARRAGDGEPASLRGRGGVSLPAMRTALSAVALVLALASCTPDPPPATPTPTTKPASPAEPIFRPAPTVIGTASLLADGTLEIRSPHGISRMGPSDPQYAPYLARMGGLRPGEEKPAPAMPDEFDAFKVEAAARAYLVKKGFDPSTCHGDIMGTDREKNVTATVSCKEGGAALRLEHGSYAVTELP